MEQARSKITDVAFFSVLFGFASGIVFNSFAAATAPMLICIGAVACAALLAACVSKSSRHVFLAAALFFASGMLGGYRNEIAKPNAERFRDSIGAKVTVEGLVVDEPADKGYSVNFTLDAGDVSMSVAARDPGPLAYGDRVAATGTLEPPENFMTDQGSEFDYVSYLYKDGILYKLKNAKVSVLSHDNGNWIVARLIPVKNAVLRSFRRVLPAREADLLAGLNLGEKSNIDDEFRNDLVDTGTIHMIALSGANVTVIANTLRDFFVDIVGLSARFAAWGGAASVALFVAMTGMQSSAVRAGIMALIAIFARGRGRTYDAFRALLFSGFLMTLWDPKYLVYDTSFQLSFLATLGIIFVTPVLDRAFVRVPKRFLFVIPLREALSVTLGAQLGVLPFILYKMGTLSIISLPANILVLPPVPLAMGLGALAGLVGSFSAMLARPIAFATYAILRYITGTISLFAKVPYAAVSIKGFSLLACLVSYAALLWFVFRFRKGYSGRN